MDKPSRLYADQLKLIQEAIRQLEYGETSQQVGATVYTVDDLPTLYSREEMLRVQAAIQAIEEGHQSYSFEGRSFTRANLKDLYDRLELLRTKVTDAAKPVRTGISLRQGVPL